MKRSLMVWFFYLAILILADGRQFFLKPFVWEFINEWNWIIIKEWKWTYLSKGN